MIKLINKLLVIFVMMGIFSCQNSELTKTAKASAARERINASEASSARID